MRRRMLVAVAMLVVMGACATPQRDQADTLATAPASVTASPSASAAAEKRTVTETQPIAFESTMVDDASLPKGQTVVRVAGVNGTKTLTFEVTVRDGLELDRTLIKEEVTTPAVTQVTAVGTKVAAPQPPAPQPPAPQPPAPPPAPSCDPNYTGACVPIASDVDCEGGGGNGPAFVRGPVYVVGQDIYDLDRDGNGVGRE